VFEIEITKLLKTTTGCDLNHSELIGSHKYRSAAIARAESRLQSRPMLW